MPRYEVQQDTVSEGWINNWTEENNDGIPQPMTFATPEEAQAEIDDLIESVQEAVLAGDMTKEYDPNDFRIVEIPDSQASRKIRVKMSRYQWETIGKTAEWTPSHKKSGKVKEQTQKVADASVPPRTCPECHGNKFIYKKLKNLGTLEMTEHMLPCNTCNGKGFVDQKDRDSYNHSMGIAPCPHAI